MLHLREGVNLGEAARRLQSCAVDARNIAGVSAGQSPRTHITSYLTRVSGVEGQLRNVFTDATTLLHLRTAAHRVIRNQGGVPVAAAQKWLLGARVDIVCQGYSAAVGVLDDRVSGHEVRVLLVRAGTCQIRCSDRLVDMRICANKRLGPGRRGIPSTTNMVPAQGPAQDHIAIAIAFRPSGYGQWFRASKRITAHVNG